MARHNTPVKGNPYKVQPEYNVSEMATMRLTNALEALMNATAIRAEDKKPILEIISETREAVLEAYNERMAEAAEHPEPQAALDLG